MEGSYLPSNTTDFRPKGVVAMRKVLRIIIPLLLALTLALFCCGCKKEDVLHAGLNAEILKVNVENKTIRVCNLDRSGQLLLEECTFDCSEAEKEDLIIYVKYGTGDVTQLSLADLQPRDDVILWIYDSELSKAESGSIAKLYEIQLGTQRLS